MSPVRVHCFCLIAEQLSWQTYGCTLYCPKTFRCVFRETNRKWNEIFQDWNELPQSAPVWSSVRIPHLSFSLLSGTHMSFISSFRGKRYKKMCKKTWLLLFLLLVFQMPDPLLGLTRCFFSEAKDIKCARKQGFHLSSCYFSSQCRTRCMVSLLAACSPHIWSCRRNHRS